MKGKYILHDYRRCPFCIRVRVLLYLKEIPYEKVEEPLRQWTLWMRGWSERVSERPRVPVLRYATSSGSETVYTESNEIMLMLDASHGEVAYTPAQNSPAYTEMTAWFEWCDEVFKHQIDRFKYGEGRQFDATAHIGDTALLRTMVGKLENALEDQKYLVEDRPSLADIAIIPFIRQIMRTREGEFDFADFPQVQRWSDEIIQTDWFVDVVMKR